METTEKNETWENKSIHANRNTSQHRTWQVCFTPRASGLVFRNLEISYCCCWYTGVVIITSEGFGIFKHTERILSLNVLAFLSDKAYCAQFRPLARLLAPRLGAQDGVDEFRTATQVCAFQHGYTTTISFFMFYCLVSRKCLILLNVLFYIAYFFYIFSILFL